MSQKKVIHITVVGNGAVGKTCMLYRYMGVEITEQYIPTIFENHNTVMNVDGEEHKVMLWDTAGQEEYEKLRTLSYSQASCCLVCFDVSRKSSFENVEDWIKDIRSCKKNIPVIIVGTKCDLRESEKDKCIPINFAHKIRKKTNALDYIECSAFTGEGVQEVFKKAVRGVIQKKKNIFHCVIF